MGRIRFSNRYIIQTMSLINKVTKSFIWVLFNNISLFVISLVLNIVLARLLSPADFGVVALAEFFLLLLNRVKELGFDYAMVHRQDRLEETASINFTLQLILGFFIAFLGIGASIITSKIYGPGIGISLFVLTITAPIKGIISAYNSLLDKGFSFRQNAIFTVLTNFLFAVFMIFFAWSGSSYLSLTLGLIPGLLFNAFAFWRISPIKLRFFWNKDLVKWFLDFGPWWFWLVASFAALIISNFDNFLIGTFLGTSVLGFYSRAYNFSSLVTEKIANAFGRVLFPVFAKFQNDKKMLGNILSLQVGLIPRFVLPLVILGFININELIILFLGSKWLPMKPIIFAFFILMLAKPLFDTFSYFLIAIGKPKEINKILIVQATFLLILEPMVVFRFREIGLAVLAGLARLAGLAFCYFKIREMINFQISNELLRSIVANISALAVTEFLYPVVGLNGLWNSLLFKTFVFSVIYIGLILIIEGEKLITDLKAFASLEGEAKSI